MIKRKISKIKYKLLKNKLRSRTQRNTLHLHALLDTENNWNDTVETQIMRHRYVGGARTLVVSW